MSPRGQFHAADDEAASVPAPSRLLRLATMALNVTMLTLATMAAGLYVFPLQ